MYSPIEVLVAIVLAALPMSRISELLIGVFERKTGITLRKER